MTFGLNSDRRYVLVNNCPNYTHRRLLQEPVKSKLTLAAVRSQLLNAMKHIMANRLLLGHRQCQKTLNECNFIRQMVIRVASKQFR
jgi:hypothetical protein